jgi:glycosyltransferase involved in cell wall biosynthesis
VAAAEANGTLLDERDGLIAADGGTRRRATAQGVAAEVDRAFSRGLGAGRRALVMVQNQSLPGDVRVWPECLALRDAGFEVVAASPASPEFPDACSHVDDIEVHRYPLRPASAGAPEYVREYAQSMARMGRLVRRLAAERHFDVVHAANPPDLLLLTAWPLRRRGTRLIFDHHDLAPELYLSRFGRRRDLIYYLSRVAERVSFRLADVVISTNDSYRRIALTRGHKRPEQVFVVRNGPNLDRFAPARPDAALRRGKPHLLVYVGVMCPQDGIDHALRALALLKVRRADWHAAFIGTGDAEADLRGLARKLGLEDVVEFTGWLEKPDVRRYLYSADIALAPDPKTPLNDSSTLVKIAEYMAACRPVVSYDLHESRVSAGDAALYARANDEQSFADCIEALLDDPPRRLEMGKIGRARVEASLSWRHSVVQLMAAYQHALPHDGPA